MRVVVAMCTLIVGVLSWQVAQACSCMPPRSAEEGFHHAAAVFTGEVKALGRDSRHVVIHLEVGEVFKGLANQEGEKIAMVTASSTAACGYPFQEGRSYLIYAHWNSERETLSVNLCSLTQVLKADEPGQREDLETLRRLGEGEGRGTLNAAIREEPGEQAAPQSTPAGAQQGQSQYCPDSHRLSITEWMCIFTSLRGEPLAVGIQPLCFQLGVNVPVLWTCERDEPTLR